MENIDQNFKSGFAVIAGLPNAGKSTLLNVLAGGLLSAVSHKPQMTRQNILALCEGADYQIIFVDTPGFLKPSYKLQQIMSNSLKQAVDEDADIVLFLFDPSQPFEQHLPIISKLKTLKCPLFLVVNKTDLQPQPALDAAVEKIKKDLQHVKDVFFISAKNAKGVTELKDAVAAALPFNPPYFPQGQWTDRWERFYAAEFIREQIFNLYEKEIPYSTFVDVEKFTEDLGDKNFIHAKIYVERESQKPIIIGKAGKAIGALRKAAEARIREFLGRKYRLELEVAVMPSWRENTKTLKQFGFIE